MIEIVYDIPPYLFLPLILLLLVLIAILVHLLANRRKRQHVKKLRSQELEDYPMLKTWNRFGTINGVQQENLKRMPQSLSSPASSDASFPVIKQSIPFSYLHFPSPANQTYSIQYGQREALVYMEGCRAPYNSIYSTISELCDGSLVCCTHGANCDLAGHPPVNEEAVKNNVTLADAAPTEKEREKLIDNMRKDLQFSDFFAHKRAKKNRKENAEKGNEQKMKTTYQVPDEEIFPRKDNPKKRDKNKPPAKDSLETAAALAKEKTVRFKDLYLGACTFSSAELNISDDVGFRLYHRMPTAEEMDDLEDQAHLYMACKNGRHFRHYPVKVRTVQESPLFYIDYGDPRTHAYSSLDELVSAFAKKVHFFEHPLPLAVDKNK